MKFKRTLPIIPCLLSLASISCNSSSEGLGSQAPKIPKEKLPEIVENPTDELPVDQVLALEGARTSFVHLFEWTWDDIAKECRDFLGPAGYKAVQVSPPNEHAIVNPFDKIDGYPWYQRYQPVSYKIESRSGNRKQFENMTKTCKDAGVDIYVDAVINHMSGVVPAGETRVGIAGSSFSHYQYPNFSYQDFHHCGTAFDDISNYGSRYEVQNCELVNLADLKTETAYVQDIISDYLADLMNLGVAGFRIDAAKHMPHDDIESIIQQASEKVGFRPYVFQEVIDQGGEPIKASEYASFNKDVTEFKYSISLSDIFKNGKLDWLNNNEPMGEKWGFLASDSAVVFTDNHDNQRGHGGGGKLITHKEAELYKLENVFMLAWPYGYPKVMSSFYFSDPSQSPPRLANGQTKAVHERNSLNCGNGQWVCEHRWKEIASMVQFRNLTDGLPINNWFSNGNNFIAFSRGDKGFVAINRESSPMQVSLMTGLPEGEYCNILQTDCESKMYVDKDGKTEVQLPAMRALAIISEF